MKKMLLSLFAFFLSTLVFAQDYSHMSHDEMSKGTSANMWFGVMELPFLFVCVFFAFKTAAALKGGVFGKGMNLMAWGFLVMAVGHIHMQVDHFFGFNLFNTILGTTAGSVAWFVALIITWSLSGLGFYYIYKASRG